MSMEMHMEMSPEQRLELLYIRVEELATDLGELGKFVKGNGDPTKGLLWLVSDLTKLLATNTQLIESHRSFMEQHIRDADRRFAEHLQTAHKKERSAFWASVQDTAVKVMVNGIVITFLALLSLGLVTFVRNGGHF